MIGGCEMTKWGLHNLYFSRSIFVAAIMSTKMEWEGKWRDTKCRRVTFHRKSQEKSALGDLRTKTVNSVRVCTRSNRFCAGRNWVHTWPSVYEYIWVQLNYTLQHTGNRSAAAWPPRRLRDCPAVFFTHYSFIPTRKNSASFINMLFFTQFIHQQMHIY